MDYPTTRNSYSDAIQMVSGDLLVRTAEGKCSYRTSVAKREISRRINADLIDDLDCERVAAIMGWEV